VAPLHRGRRHGRHPHPRSPRRGPVRGGRRAAPVGCLADRGARTQTLTLGGSTDGTAFTTEKFSAAYTFDPNTNTRNTVTLSFFATTQRYCRVAVTVTANNGWPAGQVSEFQIWNS
jgi:hypothetical protein